jgi:hypothetical protein
MTLVQVANMELKEALCEHLIAVKSNAHRLEMAFLEYIRTPCSVVNNGACYAIKLREQYLINKNPETPSFRLDPLTNRRCY